MKAVDLILKHFGDVCEQYEFEKENIQTGQIEFIKKTSDFINYDKSLMKFVKMFLSKNDRDNQGAGDNSSEEEDDHQENEKSDTELLIGDD